ncbi:DUF1295-domain-containing protein [Laetiporus sulphureus 93-53]|uniref:DUF1295-domain-containing protein n=1 Tax=Laetiporus sulphureus 93-53 TaxID=1314785 RepID=A0A165DM27_9APHY|nr:DUF1295-domain-containing protein [Laetiporus sulphureus 93-53]KZT05176.1 DUF1295-domain-containing protein [Laetiporus sulphureus 93-53]
MRLFISFKHLILPEKFPQPTPLLNYVLLPFWLHELLMPLWPSTLKDIYHAVTEWYSLRALLMLGLVVSPTHDALSLSYNTWRRGLFNFHDEDYRWQIVRNKIPCWLFQIVNLVFIAMIQNIILFLLGIPMHIAIFQQPARLSTFDYVLGALALIDIVLEFVSANQQYLFQIYKHMGIHEKNEWIGARIKWTPRDAKHGFVTRGLWTWSRHPNFFCEQTFWSTYAANALITLFPLLAPESPNLPFLSTTSMMPLWLLMPALILCVLFFSSTCFTESISLSKYPEVYSAYCEHVAMFIPLLTPLWGLLLQLREKKVQVDVILFGQDEDSKKKE